MQAWRVGGGIAVAIPNLGTRKGVDRQLYAPSTLPPFKRLGNYCVGGWMACGACLEVYGKSHLYRGLNLRPSSPWRLHYPGCQYSSKGNSSFN